MKYEVRCCCEAEKLLGWIELDGALAPWHRDLCFAPRLALSSSFAPAGGALEIVEDRQAIRLEVAELVPSPGSASYLALKSHGATLDQLRKLPGFIEAPSV